MGSDYVSIDDLNAKVEALETEVARLTEENAGLRAEVERLKVPADVSRETSRRRGARS
jgi:cell division protein FtsB